MKIGGVQLYYSVNHILSRGETNCYGGLKT